MSTIAAGHIRVDEKGVAWIEGTQVKVIEVALEKLAHGSSPEEIHFQYPHLSLVQIHAALPTITTTRASWTLRSREG